MSSKIQLLMILVSRAKTKNTQKLGSRVLQTHRHLSFKEHIEAKCKNLKSECYKDHLPTGFTRKQKTLISHYSKNRFLGLFIHLQHGSHDLCGRASSLLEEVRGKTKRLNLIGFPGAGLRPFL